MKSKNKKVDHPEYMQIRVDAALKALADEVASKERLTLAMMLRTIVENELPKIKKEGYHLYCVNAAKRSNSKSSSGESL